MRQRCGRACSYGLLCTLTALGAAFGNAPAAARASTTSVLHHFAPIYMGGSHTFTMASAVAMAKTFNVVVEQDGPLTPYVGAMHTANPGLKILVYVNGGFDTGNGSAYPASWYAHDAQGNRVQSVQFHNWLMDPTNPQWAGTVARLCQAALSHSKYDGCFLDTLGIAPLTPTYVTGLPVDKSTGKVFTPTKWIASQKNTVVATKNLLGTNPLLVNGLRDGTVYSITMPLLAASGAGMSEVFLRVSTTPVNAWPSKSSWLADVGMLVDAEGHGWSVDVVVKLWTAATAAQQQQWHAFTIATFLMGAAGHDAYNFSTARTTGALTTLTGWDNVAVGTPTAVMTLHSGVYERTFSSGLAVVNPGNSPVTVSFGSMYTNLAGQRISSESLPAHSGDVLVR